jgi:O-antigen/teichoic acid export membrane protein/aminoglycoside phosphotransferase (APT) family kinase protein
MSTATLALQARYRLAGLWRQSLVRTGHLLVANAVLNGGFGIGYWLLAARLNSPAVVAVNSAAISAMMLLAGAAQLNLMSALLRFVPTAGAAAGRMIRGAYLVGSGLSGVAAVVFLLGLHVWAPDLAGLLSPGLPAVSFVVATMLWSVFVMQDSALVAVNRPGGVPAENSAFTVLKIALIVVFSLEVHAAGIWWSWSVAMAICVVGTTSYLFGRAVPAFARNREAGLVHVASPRELRRFIGPDYVGALAWIACTSLVPLLVLDLTSPRSSAAFALPWSICFALYAVPGAFGQSLVAHSVRRQELLNKYHRQALRHTLTLLLPVVVLIVGLAPVGLHFFGPFYASHSTLTLRLLALSAVPNAVVALAVSRARVRRDMKTVVIVLVGLSVFVLGLTVLLVPRLGIVGGGIAWLTGQCVVATALLVRGHAAIARPRLARPSRGGVPAGMVRAALTSGNCRRERTLRTESETSVMMVHLPQAVPGVLKVAATESAMASLRREAHVLSRLKADERLGAWRALLPVPLDAGSVNGGGFLLTSRLPGQPLPAHAGRRLTSAAVYALAPLHRLDRTVRPVDDTLLNLWVDEPAERISSAIGDNVALNRLAAALRSNLAGRRVTLGWTHGDFYAGNLLAGTGGFSGIIDWSQARQEDLLALDLTFWLVTVPAREQPPAFGARVAAGLNLPWTPAESRVISTVTDADPLTKQTLLLLTWLRHVASNLGKSDRYVGSVLWSRRNVAPVLRLVTGRADGRFAADTQPPAVPDFVRLQSPDGRVPRYPSARQPQAGPDDQHRRHRGLRDQPRHSDTRDAQWAHERDADPPHEDEDADLYPGHHAHAALRPGHADRGVGDDGRQRRQGQQAEHGHVGLGVATAESQESVRGGHDDQGDDGGDELSQMIDGLETAIPQHRLIGGRLDQQRGPHVQADRVEGVTDDPGQRVMRGGARSQAVDDQQRKQVGAGQDE